MALHGIDLLLAFMKSPYIPDSTHSSEIHFEINKASSAFYYSYIAYIFILFYI